MKLECDGKIQGKLFYKNNDLENLKIIYLWYLNTQGGEYKYFQYVIDEFSQGFFEYINEDINDYILDLPIWKNSEEIKNQLNQANDV